MEMVQLATLVTILLVVIVALLAWFFGMRGAEPVEDEASQTDNLAPDAEVEPDERPSSIAAEQIESSVREALSTHPDLADVALDFGAMPDGTIDIWVNDTQYNDVEDIPDERIRSAVKAAVQKFNRS